MTRRVLGSRKGAAGLEFALVGAAACMLLLGAMDIARYLVALQSLRDVASQAARDATLLGSSNMNAGRAPCDGLAGIRQTTPNAAPWGSQATVTFSGCATWGATSSVTVSARQPFSFVLPFLATGALTLSEETKAYFN